MRKKSDVNCLAAVAAVALAFAGSALVSGCSGGAGGSGLKPPSPIATIPAPTSDASPTPADLAKSDLANSLEEKLAIDPKTGLLSLPDSIDLPPSDRQFANQLLDKANQSIKEEKLEAIKMPDGIVLAQPGLAARADSQNFTLTWFGVRIRLNDAHSKKLVLLLKTGRMFTSELGLPAGLPGWIVTAIIYLNVYRVQQAAAPGRGIVLELWWWGSVKTLRAQKP